jgi:CheY-like chemotaxis protein
MHGSIGLHSEPGIGSSFWIELPLIRRGGTFTVPEDSSKPAQQPRIFYVEDNPASQFLVRKALADLGEVSVASNGRVALEQILAAPPDLLLLDLNLPGLNGDEVLRQLRLDPRTKGLQVIVLSAVAVSEVMRMASLDCQGLLSKPVDVAELRGLVKAILYGVTADAD